MSSVSVFMTCGKGVLIVLLLRHYIHALEQKDLRSAIDSLVRAQSTLDLNSQPTNKTKVDAKI